MTTLAWSILWIPFFCAALIHFFLLKKPRPAALLAVGGIFASLILTILLLLRFRNAGPFESSIAWIPLGSGTIEFGVLVNGLTMLMLLIVTGVGSLIFLYSMEYMEHDAGCARYFAFLSFFAFSMLGIVLANNLIQIFIFWELVGLSSYLLIGFWYEKPEAATAGKKAFLTTRVGDVGMMIGILLLFGILFRDGIVSFNFQTIENWMKTPHAAPDVMTAAALLLFLGVVGKSAQVPLHVWLPDAMEGPTPVSALIHAATMVAAGVFLLARLFFIFSASALTLSIISWTGGLTAILAATIALVQNDIKKILAYSTLSQLGYMVLAIGLGNPEAGMFHLTTHAFFKALLFLGAGSMIHALETQDIRQMACSGGLFPKLWVTNITFSIGALSLIGLPPFSSLYSKDLILETAMHKSSVLFNICFYIGLPLTYWYVLQLLWTIYVPKKNKIVSLHEGGWSIKLPLIILACFCFYPIFKKILSMEIFLPATKEISGPSTHGGILFATLFVFFISRFSQIQLFMQPILRIPQKILDRKFFFDDTYDALIKYVHENIARASDAFERAVIVETMVNGTARFTRAAGNILRKFQTGVVQFYALVFAAGVTVLIYLFILAGCA